MERSKQSVVGSYANSFFTSIVESTVADKLTIMGFVGTFITVVYSSITFLPHLESRVNELEDKVKTMPKEIEQMKLDAAHLSMAAKNSEEMIKELGLVKNENANLKGKVEVLEKMVIK